MTERKDVRRPKSRERLTHVLFAASGVIVTGLAVYGPSWFPPVVGWIGGFAISLAWLVYALRHTSVD